MQHASMAQKLTYLLFISILSACAATHNHKQSVNAIPYPQPVPDSTAIIFLPNLVSKDSLDFNACFSPDGKSFYFTRSMNKQSKIYVTHHNGVNWAEPLPVPLAAASYSDADPAFAPDGKLYFISNRPKDQSDTLKDYDIWFTTPRAGGGWSKPENLESINSDSSEFYISFSENGNLYFASSRKGGYGEEDIYVSRLMNGLYTIPANLGTAVNSPRSEYDPFISAKEDLIVFASSGRDDSFGGADLYCSKPDNNKKWLQPVNLGKKINTKTREFCAYFSPDSRYFFFSSERDVKWISAQYLKDQIDKLW